MDTRGQIHPKAHEESKKDKWTQDSKSIQKHMKSPKRTNGHKTQNPSKSTRRVQKGQMDTRLQIHPKAHEESKKNKWTQDSKSIQRLMKSPKAPMETRVQIHPKAHEESKKDKWTQESKSIQKHVKSPKRTNRRKSPDPSKST
ncbi:hypothetical protein QYM36_004361 [Artemia franciscana]|uniref:Uncharacterized protein n=1 Tax=Artemia franciscana TaxID=6661 RepID=A0AA88L6N0_ARTSF|nr:hypothetical protein QYM36_004361 [Artemia franciscana]